jgi:hypothetical protein
MCAQDFFPKASRLSFWEDYLPQLIDFTRIQIHLIAVFHPDVSATDRDAVRPSGAVRRIDEVLVNTTFGVLAMSGLLCARVDLAFEFNISSTRPAEPAAARSQGPLTMLGIQM